MSWEKTKSVMMNWDKEAYRSLHHEDFLFIRETELVTLDDHIENIHKYVTEEDGAAVAIARSTLMHENDAVLELRWEDNGESVTNVFLKKRGLFWRSIVSRTPIEEAA